MYTIERKRSGSGCASDFYKLKGLKNKGFKTFENYESAYIAHYNQTKLAEHNLAPYVYSEVGRVRVGIGNKLSRWGYVTEIAETLGCGGNTCTCGECDHEDLECEFGDAIEELTSEMEDLGFWFGDNHIGNVGYVYRNGWPVLVCIDTGDESVSSDDGPCFCLVCKKGGNCRE
jgi:hypothetical protein